MASGYSPKDPKAGTPGTQRPEKFAHHIEGVEFPASKRDLIEKARGAAAPDEIVLAIERLPATRFESMEEVLTAYESAGHDLQTGRSKE